MPAQHFNRGYDTEPVSSYDVAVVASAGEYAGTYLFGDTEFEWTLVIDCALPLSYCRCLLAAGIDEPLGLQNLHHVGPRDNP